MFRSCRTCKDIMSRRGERSGRDPDLGGRHFMAFPYLGSAGPCPVGELQTDISDDAAHIRWYH